METGWWNGDRVIKPFYLNDYYFDEGDKFMCASALGSRLKRFKEEQLNKNNEAVNRESNEEERTV
jgi:hypothetical protein